LFNERRSTLERLLSVKAFVPFSEMETLFPDVSVMTLRRDVEALEKQGLCLKVRGGAKSQLFMRESTDGKLAARMHENVAAKEAVARQAAAFLEPGRSIFLDSGSTLQRIVPFISNDHFSFVTTSPQLALDLCRIGQSSVNLVGGMMDAENLTVSGMQAMDFIERMNIDIALLSPSGLSVSGSFTVGNYTESELKRAVVKKARLTVLLLDGSKIGKAMPYTFCEMEEADAVITDAPLTPSLLEKARASGTQILNAASGLPERIS